MGIIQRQSIKHTLVSYIGVVVGLLSSVLLYPIIGIKELYGFFKIIESLTVLSATFFSLGLVGVSIRFLPRFKKEDNNNGFLPFLILAASLGFILYLIAFPFLRYFICERWYNEEPLVQNYVLLLLPLCAFFIFKNILKSYISGFQRVVIPNLIDDLLTKISIPLLCILVLFECLCEFGFAVGLVIHYFVVLGLLIVYARHLGIFTLKTNWSFFTKDLQKEIGTYAAFNIFTSLASKLAFRIDALMVGILISVNATGVYTILSIITQVIQKPSLAIFSISSPIIAKNWKENNLTGIKEIYQKSSTTLLLSGCFIFLGIWLSIDDLLFIMPDTKGMTEGKYVVLFTGLYILVDMATSVNSHIIAYSAQYRFNLYALLTLAVLNIFFNIIFIGKYGLVGAAIATLCSNVLFNLMKVLFIYYKFKMQPFTRATFKIIGLTLFSYGVILLIPTVGNPFLDILIRSILLSLIFLPSAYFWNISPDANQLLLNGLYKIKAFFK